MRFAKHLIIQVRVCDEFKGRTLERSVRLTVVDSSMDSDVGPSVTEQTLDFIERQNGSGSSVWTHDKERRTPESRWPWRR